MNAAAVFITTDNDIDFEGDEVTVHHVFVGTEDAEPVGKTYTVRRGRDAAFDLAERIAADRRLEVVVD